MTPADVEIRWVSKEDIYDLFVNGRFRNFYKTFGEAALAAEEAARKDVVTQWLEMPKKKGKVHFR